MIKFLCLALLAVLPALRGFAQSDNTLSDEERKDGWQLLFDGNSLGGWHTFNKPFMDGKWAVTSGTIHLLDRDKAGLGTSHDLVTDEVFGDFDFKAEWKIAQQGNSGIMLHVQEGPYSAPSQTGPEMQVLDNDGNPNGQQAAGRAGSLFSLIPCTPDNARSPGNWNQVEILCKDGVLKFFQNGVNVVTTTLWDDSWKRLIAPRLAKWPDFGSFKSGKIDLQDMAGEVWYRNVKIKRLDGAGGNTGASAAAGASAAGGSANAGAGAAGGSGQASQDPQVGGSDLSGYWEGTQTNGNLVMYYAVGLVRTGDNTYIGFDSCRWVRNSDNTPINAKGDLPHCKKVFVGKFENGVLGLTEVADMPHGNWGMGTEQFRWTNNNGTAQLVNNDKSQPNRHVNIKRSGQGFPQEFLPYLIHDSTLQIEAISFSNSLGQPTLRYNDHGKLIVSVKNNALVDLSKVNARVVVSEGDNGIQDYDRADPYVVHVAKSANADVPLPVVTNFSVPAGVEHFTILFYIGNFVFAKKDVVISTTSFFKTDKVVLPETGNARARAVDNYYGTSGTPYASPAAPINALAASGDKLAPMWKAIFMYKGSGGYKEDAVQAEAVAKPSLEAVERSAGEGNAEALYLMFYACNLGFEGRSAIPYGQNFLEKAALAGFKPAVYDYALLALRKKNYDIAFSYLTKSFNMGVRKAASNIGAMYEAGHSAEKNMDSAVAWYKKGIVFGDPAAMVNLALLYSAGFGDSPPDINKALELASRAADKDYPPAMIFSGSVYFNGKQGKPQNIPIAVKWFKRAADLGDENGMLRLGIADLANNIPGAARDEASAYFWIKKAAEAGEASAMQVLSNFYSEGTGTEKNIIRARYWYNQAVLRGAAEKDDAASASAQADFSNFWKFADFSPSYVYVNGYNEVVGDSGPDFFGGMLSGIFGSVMQRYANAQPEINGLEFIQQKNGYKIYGGTVSSYFISSLELKQGQTVSVKAYGVISTGMFSGNANADGLGNAWPEYRIVPTIPCSAVMAGVKDSNWQFIGQSASYTAPKDGPLVFALNAIDYRQYKGYFDLVVQVSGD